MTDSIDRVDPSPPAANGAAPQVLPRRLGMFGLLFLIIAFNAPLAAMAGFQQLTIGFGNGVGAPGAFLVAGAILLLFAVGFVSMSRHSPNPGAYYRYVVDGLGKSAGLAGAFLATAAYVIMTAGTFMYLGLILVDMTARLFGDPVLNWQAWSLIALALIAFLGLLRIDLSMKVLGVLVLIEVVVVALWELAVFIQGGPEGYSASSWAPAEFFSGSVGPAVLFAMLTLIGIEGAACFRDEARDPERSVGRATYLGIGFLMVFYALGSWAYIITQGASNAVSQAQTDPVGSFNNSIESYLGSVFVNLVVIALVTSQIAATNTVLGMSSRYLFALGRDGVLPRQLAMVHPRLQSPYVAILTVIGFSLLVVVGVIVSGMDVVQAYAALTGAGIYFLIPLLIATSVAVIVYFRRNPHLSPGPWAGLVAPALAAAGLLVLFVLTTQNLEILVITRAGAVGAFIGVAVLVGGGVLLGRYYKRAKPDVYERIGNPV